MTNSKIQGAQSERALRTLLYTMLVGVLAILANADLSSWTRFFSFMGTGLIVAAAALIIGGLLGFLFGIPRTLQQSNPAPAPAAADKPEDEESANSRGSLPEYQANTNLEQISDWLTKILVGVGLTQVRGIIERLQTISSSVAAALGSAQGNRSFAMALILFYLTTGFLFAYLWTRLYLAGAFRDADRALVDEIQTLKTKVDRAELRSKDALATSIGTGKSEPQDVIKKLLAATEGIAPGDPNDHWKGRFGGKSINNGRQLKAEVKPIPGSSGLFSVRLTVSSIPDNPNPLTGAAQFFLHPTFNNPTPEATVGPNGVAELNLKAWGAFTVGALADDGETKLELDLSEMESAPAEFRSR